jgi:uncharacterized protein
MQSKRRLRALIMSVTNKIEKISTEEALRKIIKSYPKILDKRIQPTLDNYSIEFIAQASIAAATFSDLSLGMPILDVKGDYFSINSLSTLSFIIPTHKDHTHINNMPCSLYFLIPGIGHGLRINGKAHQIKSASNLEHSSNIVFDIQSVYLHCARAITRAELWISQLKQHNPTIKNIIENSPYLLLSTQNALGNTELSPRGDPAGFVKLMDESTLLLPERPGNKIAVSLTNIINNSNVGLSFLVPGSNTVLYVEGKAYLTTDPILLKPLAIKNKVPKIAILISINNLQLDDSAAIERTKIWEKESHVSSKSLTTFSKALTAHIQGEGLLGKISNPIMSGIIKHDMNNLY